MRDSLADHIDSKIVLRYIHQNFELIYKRALVQFARHGLMYLNSSPQKTAALEGLTVANILEDWWPENVRWGACCSVLVIFVGFEGGGPTPSIFHPVDLRIRLDQVCNAGFLSGALLLRATICAFWQSMYAGKLMSKLLGGHVVISCKAHPKRP